jgi:hypothetical protein
MVIFGIAVIIAGGAVVAIAQIRADLPFRAVALSNTFKLDTRAVAGAQSQVGDLVVRQPLAGSALSNDFAINTKAKETSTQSPTKPGATTLSTTFMLDTAQQTPASR